MPTYEYKCECGKVFEYEQRISEPALTVCPFCTDGKDCPNCGKKQTPCKVERLIVAGNFILKGNGWYKDGYGTSKPENNGSGSLKANSDKSDIPKADTVKTETTKNEPKKECGTTCGCD